MTTFIEGQEVRVTRPIQYGHEWLLPGEQLYVLTINTYAGGNRVRVRCPRSGADAWVDESDLSPVEDQAEADERGEMHRNRFAGSAHRKLTYVEELQALSLPELIDRYARTYHRAANQPNNAELASICSMLKRLIGRALEGWVPLDDIERWCDR